MESVFRQIPVVNAAGITPQTFTLPTVPQFAATAAAEINEEVTWQTVNG